jgi:hypothetical protein
MLFCGVHTDTFMAATLPLPCPAALREILYRHLRHKEAYVYIYVCKMRVIFDYLSLYVRLYAGIKE